MRPRVPVERLGPGDVVELVTDAGPVPMNVGALLRLGAGTTSAAEVAATLVERAARVPRLRQVVVGAAPGLGGRYWADAGTGSTDLRRHVSVQDVGADDLDALVAAAADVVTTPLARDRPLWRAVVLAAGGEPVGVVLALHHVLADGVAGLALLDRLTDAGAPDAPTAGGSRPGTIDLAADALARHGRRLRALPAAWRTFVAAGAELGVGGERAPRCSLNAATGPQRRAATSDVDLDLVRTAARAAGATVNDVLLVAVTGAMGRLLHERGERVPALVVSVPVAVRTAHAPGGTGPGAGAGRGAGRAPSGNQVGVMAVPVALAGSPAARLAAVAATTRTRRSTVRGRSAHLVAPAFRLLAALGLFRWFVDRQRLVSTFLSNVPGPPQALRLAGRTVTGVVPLTVTAGNVGVAFAALSYAGRLGITVITDPDVVPESARLVAHLRDELAAVIGVGPSGQPDRTVAPPACAAAGVPVDDAARRSATTTTSGQRA